MLEPYSQAIDRQMQLLDFQTKAHDAIRLAPNSLIDAEDRRSATSELRGFIRACAVGDTYVVSPQITTAIRAAADQLSLSVVMREDILPSNGGFVWCDTELPIPRERETPWGSDTPYYGFMWERAEWSQSGKRGVLISGVTVVDGVARPLASVSWLDGSELSALLATTVVRLERNDSRLFDDGDMASMRFIVAMWLFMQQRILVTRQQRPSRAVARRAKSFRDDPVLRVIELRSREYQTVQREGEAEHRDYSCQWIVRGHWRQQWYPSLGRHQPKWITPHVKGPSDAPLKTPRANVFAVVR
jgi:hypothetical protein